MGGGVVELLCAVAGAGEDAAVGAEDDGADRDLAARGGGFGFGQCGCIGSVNMAAVIAGCLRRRGLYSVRRTWLAGVAQG